MLEVTKTATNQRSFKGKYSKKTKQKNTSLQAICASLGVYHIEVLQ